MIAPLADVHVAGGVRFFRLTEWRTPDDLAARAARVRFRESLEAQGVRTLERALEVPGLTPGTTRVVVALFRDGEEASSASTARVRAARHRKDGIGQARSVTSSPTP
jgi:hypothetical protein